MIELMERGLIPQPLIRVGIRQLLARRLREQRPEQLTSLLEQLDASPIALHPEKANSQHYELPAAFFERIMGRYLKYSACYWPEGVDTLDEAEAAMLALTCEGAEIGDGQDILELGCGWGSLTLWLAEHYPRARITAVSNSAPQRRHIEAACVARGLANVRVLTADMNDFSIDTRFDRVVSVEMFEHMRNYRVLMNRIAGWLRPGGRLFVHVFSHRELAYPFETEGDDNWMGRYFFTGGIMPSRDLLPRFQDDLTLDRQWHINGRHYQRTCEAWLANQERDREAIMALFRDTYGSTEAARWFQRWRVFFMACAELFGYRDGEEWGVSHYRFRRP
ncbi:MAG: cyclopropane-fatty-acyl-phospholipid synthase family protein [Candidatus Competibacterales bacterium]|nr:cyclopropane-fatty-acyl-phospholipid synthase family protein [Candidatus Competibacterales bacterium]